MSRMASGLRSVVSRASTRRPLTSHLIQTVTPHLRPSRPPAFPLRFSSTSSSPPSDNAPSSPPADPPPTTDPIIYPSPSSTKHHNLPTFLAHAARHSLNPTSTTYVGTHYEYTVQRALAPYGFLLRRIGGAGDNGIDLLGTWAPPLPQTQSTRAPRRAILQCKSLARKSTTQHIRELEGALIGSPRAWRGSTIAWLVSVEPATRGMREVMRVSKSAMGFVCCSREGVVRQMLWNHAAVVRGLHGLGVTVRHGGDVVYRPERQEVRLVWKGEVLPFVEVDEGMLGRDEGDEVEDKGEGEDER